MGSRCQKIVTSELATSVSRLQSIVLRLVSSSSALLGVALFHVAYPCFSMSERFEECLGGYASPIAESIYKSIRAGAIG